MRLISIDLLALARKRNNRPQIRVPLLSIDVDYSIVYWALIVLLLVGIIFAVKSGKPPPLQASGCAQSVCLG